MAKPWKGNGRERVEDADGEGERRKWGVVRMGGAE